MNIYIIIVTYNAENWLNTCIGSVYDRGDNIIIVDNASSDKTVEIIKQNYSSVHLVESKENLGFGKANNIGLNIALNSGADYVLLLNQDAWIESDTIDKLIKIQFQQPNYWILSPLQLNTKKQGVEALFQKYLQQSSVDITNCDEVVELKFANAAIWLMSRNCIEIVGGFDFLFPHYGEDNDYVNRLHYWGGKVGLVKDAIGYHERDVNDKININKSIYKYTLGIVGLLNDINKPLIYNLFEQIFRLITKSLKYSIKRNFVELRIYNVSFLKSILQIRKIRLHRKMSKIKGAYLESR